MAGTTELLEQYHVTSTPENVAEREQYIASAISRIPEELKGPADKEKYSAAIRESFQLNFVLGEAIMAEHERPGAVSDVGALQKRAEEAATALAVMQGAELRARDASGRSEIRPFLRIVSGESETLEHMQSPLMFTNSQPLHLLQQHEYLAHLGREAPAPNVDAMIAANLPAIEAWKEQNRHIDLPPLPANAPELLNVLYERAGKPPYNRDLNAHLAPVLENWGAPGQAEAVAGLKEWLDTPSTNSNTTTVRVPGIYMLGDKRYHALLAEMEAGVPGQPAPATQALPAEAPAAPAAAPVAAPPQDASTAAPERDPKKILGMLDAAAARPENQGKTGFLQIVEQLHQVEALHDPSALDQAMDKALKTMIPTEKDPRRFQLDGTGKQIFGAAEYAVLKSEVNDTWRAPADPAKHDLSCQAARDPEFLRKPEIAALQPHQLDHLKAQIAAAGLRPECQPTHVDASGVPGTTPQGAAGKNAGRTGP